MARSLVFLVTGSSSGIGRAIAREAAAVGHRVFASARNPEDLAELSRPGVLEPIALDVTDAPSVTRALDTVRDRAGRLDVLVNNAGWGQMGAVEDVSIERWRALFEVNVFGLLRVTQAALPLMRSGGGGSIVNIGSIAGRISYPFGGAYCASKFAVEAISDALRLEVERFGIRVVLIEPGPIESRFAQRAEAEVQSLAADASSPYRDLYETAYERFRLETKAGALPPEAVARVVLKAAASRRPRARYLVTRPAKVFALAKRLLPDAVIDAGMRSKFRSRKPEGGRA
jgi:NAD(P)-dependent dehydrogenase (short-subunit alcohol dehydrogenase family)